jgi:hypothetical protein
MSIKGIDNQMMVTRAAEYAKEASNMRQHGEVFQTQMQQQGVRQAETAATVVTETAEAEQAEIRRRQEAPGRRRGKDKDDGRQAEDEERRDWTDDDLSAGFDEGHLIDIEI